jgi:hypothetical protein
VHDAAHLAPVDIEIVGVFVVEDQKAITVRMGMDLSGYQVLPIEESMVILFKPDQAALTAQLPERVDNLLQIVAGKPGAPVNFNGR